MERSVRRDIANSIYMYTENFLYPQAGNYRYVINKKYVILTILTKTDVQLLGRLPYRMNIYTEFNLATWLRLVTELNICE